MKTLLLAILFPTLSLAQDMYKCEVGGKTTYQAKPCTEGATQERLGSDEHYKGHLDLGVEGRAYSVYGFTVEVDKYTDSGEQVYYKWKASVSNKTRNDMKVSVAYQAVDSKGFEIEYLYVTGKVQAKSTNVLTGSSIMDTYKFNRIKEWRVKP